MMLCCAQHNQPAPQIALDGISKEAHVSGCMQLCTYVDGDALMHGLSDCVWTGLWACLAVLALLTLLLKEIKAFFSVSNADSSL